MRVSVSRSLPLKFFPFLGEKVWFDSGLDKRFLLKCPNIDQNGFEFFLTHEDGGNIDFKSSLIKNGSIRVLFSANKDDLIKYTEMYDSYLDIFPVESMEFKGVDFLVENRADWIVFTSKRAVEFFFKKVSVRYMCDKKVAAVGEKTATALIQKGFKLDYIPEEFYGASLIEFLKDKGKLIVVTAMKYNRVYDELDNVTVVPVYENVVPERIQYFRPTGEFDFGVFSSPSAFWHLKEAFGGYNFAEKIKRIVAIGKTTRSYIESCGFKAEMPAKATINDMFKYIMESI